MPIYLYFLILFILGRISWIDWKIQKIPNKLVIILLFLFPLFFILEPTLYSGMQTILYPLTILGIGFIFFLMKLMGAGDVKLLFALSLLIPNQEKEMVFTILLYTTLVWSTLRLIWSVFKNKKEVIFFCRTWQLAQILIIIRSHYAYAPVIFFSWILYFFVILNL